LPKRRKKRRPAPKYPQTVNEVLDAFWAFGLEYYRDHAKSTIWNYRHAVQLVRQDYGDTLAASFDSIRLDAIQQAMIDNGLSRTTINMHTCRIKRVFKWAAKRKLVPVPNPSDAGRTDHESARTGTNRQESPGISAHVRSFGRGTVAISPARVG
jgi:integrase